MDERINWMLGMTENMMGISMNNMDKMHMPEMYAMTSTLMGNLNHMKMMGMANGMTMGVMEPIMKNM